VTPPEPALRKDVLSALALAATYAAVGAVTLSLPDTSVELRRMIWLPSGIALAWLMMGGIRLWPGLAIGAAFTTAITGGAPLFAVGTGFGNTLEVVLAAWLLQRAGISRQLQSRRHLVVFVSTLIVTSALGAIVSVGSLRLSGGLRTTPIAEVWFMWWLTHVMGSIVATPLLLSRPNSSERGPPMPVWESIVLSIGLGLTLSFNFTALVPRGLSSLPLTFLPFPFLVWAAYRCGQFGASSASFAAAAFAVVGTLLGIGPFVHPSPNMSLLMTLVFVSAAEFSTLFTAGIVAERRCAEEDRARFERRMRRSDKLESLGALAGGIAHDFNNLLVAIMGNVDLVLMDTRPGEPAHEPLEESVKASKRAAELCRQLLAYAGQGPYEHAVVDLSTIVRDITALLRVTVPKGAEVEYDLAPETLPLRADTIQLRRVVLNLFANAGEALGAHQGQITIRTYAALGADWDQDDLVSYLDIPEGPVAVLEIEDTGEGIGARDLERIFEPVFTTRGSGRGLGLASVLGIVRGHGGAIQVHSEPGRGTTFTVAFPLVDEPIDLIPAPPLPQLGHRSGNVLVVDDEPAVLSAAVALVRRLGYEAVEATNGAAALRTLEEIGDDLTFVLLDITMPGKSGLDVLREVRERKIGLPVLLSSGYVLQPIEILAELGPVRFLPKPYTLAGLEDAIEELLVSTPALPSG